MHSTSPSLGSSPTDCETRRIRPTPARRHPPRTAPYRRSQRNSVQPTSQLRSTAYTRSPNRLDQTLARLNPSLRVGSSDGRDEQRPLSPLRCGTGRARYGRCRKPSTTRFARFVTVGRQAFPRTKTVRSPCVAGCRSRNRTSTRNP